MVSLAQTLDAAYAEAVLKLPSPSDAHSSIISAVGAPSREDTEHDSNDADGESEAVSDEESDEDELLNALI